MHTHGRGREFCERAPDVSQQEAVCCQTGGESAGLQTLLYSVIEYYNVLLCDGKYLLLLVIVFMDPIS